MLYLNLLIGKTRKTNTNLLPLKKLSLESLENVIFSILSEIFNRKNKKNSNYRECLFNLWLIVVNQLHLHTSKETKIMSFKQPTQSDIN
ncbi:hypothetical protein BpHYR1_027960 [Brachionus plicatilis]|uniref:Uncharacterized protein n=1 Tax=Brachionus plicatilis TaxID=10195 RepID=A0A3M7RUY7_BRAPC|nr:hypothetical protein BpHYR1_027960 [Brachionus plicatilis]